MRDGFRANALFALISTAMAACGSPQQAGSDAGVDAAGGTDAAAGGDGPSGFFIVGDIDGQTWLATYNIGPVDHNWVFAFPTVEPAPATHEWYFNITLPADPFPYTLVCISNYIEFHQLPPEPERRFVSRTQTATCEITFVEPAEVGTLEGTFSANLTLSGTTMNYPVTNGRFRLPRAP